MIYTLIESKHPLLHSPLPEITAETEPKDRLELTNNIAETMKHYGGIGLSANQVGIALRMFVFGDGKHFIPCFNPKILEWSEDTTYMREGCLSFPGLWIAIERAKSVAIKFQVFDGEEQAGSMTDLSARVFQHESEHMDGDLFIDNVTNFKLKSAMRKRNINLRKLKKQNKK